MCSADRSDPATEIPRVRDNCHTSMATLSKTLSPPSLPPSLPPPRPPPTVPPPPSPPLPPLSPPPQLPRVSTGVQVVEIGEPQTPTFRLVYLDSHGFGISPWTHIPLHNREGHMHILCTTPRGSKPQLELATSELWTPLRHRLRDGHVSFFSHAPLWNFGILPQTWADKEDHVTSQGGLNNDNRPVEVVEIGFKNRVWGEVYAVKALGAFAVVDAVTYEISWKVVAIAAEDAMAGEMEGVRDLNEKMGGTLERIREWLRVCHVTQPDDRENIFGLNERAADVKEAMAAIAQAHASWQLLTADSAPHQRLALELSMYAPWTWAKIHGIQPSHMEDQRDDVSINESESQSMSSDCSSLTNEFEKLPTFLRSPGKLLRPAYIELMPLVEHNISNQSGTLRSGHNSSGSNSSISSNSSFSSNNGFTGSNASNNSYNNHVSNNNIVRSTAIKAPRGEVEKAWKEAERNLSVGGLLGTMGEQGPWGRRQVGEGSVRDHGDGRAVEEGFVQEGRGYNAKAVFPYGPNMYEDRGETREDFRLKLFDHDGGNETWEKAESRCVTREGGDRRERGELGNRGERGERGERGDRRVQQSSTLKHMGTFPVAYPKSKVRQKRVSWSEFVEVREIPARESSGEDEGGRREMVEEGLFRVNPNQSRNNKQHQIEAWHGLSQKTRGRDFSQLDNVGTFGNKYSHNGHLEDEFTLTEDTLMKLRQVSKQRFHN